MTQQRPPSELRSVFARHGLRCTQQRQVLYEVLVSTDRHPTAEQLYRMVGERDSGLSMATVYNTLEAFCEAGLCLKLAALNGSCRYDGATHDHLHFKDVRTGEIRDVPEEISEMLLDSIPREVLSEIEKKMGIKLHRIDVDLIGEDIPPG
ncbi:MAG: transcriptional repressor [Phycisphaerales bacterium]|nr:transcriptional repressor [Phycisphaerales bacterium]